MWIYYSLFSLSAIISPSFECQCVKSSVFRQGGERVVNGNIKSETITTNSSYDSLSLRDLYSQEVKKVFPRELNFKQI